MEFTRRRFLKRLVGTSALVAVPSLGLAKQVAEKMVIDRDVDHMYPIKFTYEIDKTEWAKEHYTFDAAQELENILAKELDDAFDKELFRLITNAV